MKQSFAKQARTIGLVSGVLGLSVLAFSWGSTPKAIAGDSCEYTCPSVEFSWKTSECPSQDSAYTSDNDHKACKRKFENGRHDYYKYADKVETNHTVNVTYEKSQDPHKCHRPSDNTLETTYGMDHSARDDFKRANSEWKDAIESESCNQPTPTCTPGVTPTVTPEVTPTVTPEVTPEVTPTITPEVTPTTVPYNPPSPHGDGLSDGKSDGRSDGKSDGRGGAVLGASIGGGDVLGASTYAGTGVSFDMIMNAIGVSGAAFTAIGAALSKRTKQS